MGLLYNAAQLAKYGITTPPTSWAQYAADAAAVHKANPKVFFGDFAAGDGQWVLALMQQSGAWPFVWNGGANVTINFTGPKQMAFANWWQNSSARARSTMPTTPSPAQPLLRRAQ